MPLLRSRLIPLPRVHVQPCNIPRNNHYNVPILSRRIPRHPPSPSGILSNIPSPSSVTHNNLHPNIMRGLNLSRLARASEGTYFKSEQSVQASALRKTLSPSQLNSLRQRARPEPSVDTLPEISAHTAYNRLDAPPLPLPTTKPSPSIPPAAIAHPPVATPDPPILQALGARKLELYHAHASQATPVRPLPGGEKYADGAVLGMTSLSVATALVSSVGIAVGGLVYLNPGIVDAIRDRTRRFSRRVDATIGQRLRDSVERRNQRGPLVGEEGRVWIGGLLRSAVGGGAVEGERRDEKGDRQRRQSEEDG